MKHHIAVKFIAIFLCAASLLGTIGGIAGVVALTETDLYNKTVDQVIYQRVEGNATAYGRNLALMYASSTLGSCPEDMVQDLFGDASWFENTYGNFGYTIQDAEGNVLSSYNPELTGASVKSIYSVPVTGQYMHLVSVESEADIAAREAAEYAERYGVEVPSFGDNPAIPAEGISVNSVMFRDQNVQPVYEASCYDYEYNVTYHYGNSSSSGYGVGSNTNQAGRLFCNQYGELVYISYEVENFEPLPTTDIHSAVFINEELGFSFHVQDLEYPIGTLSMEGGIVTFRSVPLAENVATAEPALAEELGWTVESVSEDGNILTLVGPDGGTLQVSVEDFSADPEETVPETTAAAIPEETAAPAETTAPAATEASAEAAAETAAVETTAAETAPAETVPSSASAVPEETVVAAPAETAAPAQAEATAPTETLPPETTVPAETVVEETIPEETVPEVTEPVLINGKPLDQYQINSHSYYDTETQQQMTARYVYVPMPELTVEVYVDKDSMQDSASYELLALIRQYRSYLLPAVGVCLLVFAIFAVYLCTAAGRSAKSEEIKAGGLNRMPLDVYLFGGSFLIAACINYGAESLIFLIRQNLLVGCATCAGLFFLACLIFVGFCFAFVAQTKTPGGFWWRNSLCGICIRLFMRFAVWLEVFLAEKGFPYLRKAAGKLWELTKAATLWSFHSLEKGASWLLAKLNLISGWTGKKIKYFAALLPLTWQWMLAGFLAIIVLIVGVDGFKDGSDLALPVSLLLTTALVLYGSHCFGVLLDSTKKMAKGDLDSKVDDKLMVGCFQDFASDLNDLAGVAVVAAQKQLKSERMKTELITNVSHDIKTPLTSIINYVDLLQKPHTEEEEAQYLEVLDRQSQRLKKLIDDLMDMSKASTGNMAVEITQVDAVESVNQALGEFADKLDRVGLIPVFRHEEDRVPMMADGKLVWRVLSNLLSNAVKYAMPGTRLYLDLMTLEGKVILSLKNISRDELNIDAEELMERFVRGDDARNTEGSGLGLNIAKSLMELQKGQLQLLVDGDLFKVTLIFPGA